MDGQEQPTLEGDRDLLARFKKGEQTALGRVFDLYVADVAQTLRAGVVVRVDGQQVRVGKGLPEADFEALLQETFARAFAERARQSYDGLRPYGAYLATIARNLVVDRGRELLRAARTTSGVDVELVADGAPGPGWQLEERQIQQILAAFKAGLDEADRALFRLRYEDQLSHPQTAKAMGISEITVRRKDTRLRARLLEALRTEGFLLDRDVVIGQSLLSRRPERSGR